MNEKQNSGVRSSGVAEYASKVFYPKIQDKRMRPALSSRRK